MDIEILYKNIAPKLTSYLVANGTQYCVAAEIVQETFLRVWKQRDNLTDDEAQISGFIYTIARNLRNDRHRRDKVVTFTDEPLGEELATTSESNVRSDSDYLRARLMKAMNQLPPLLKEAYLLFQISELSVKEIARQMNISEALVKVRIFRAKERLKELLADLKQW